MLLRAVPDRALDDILSGVSRSFYLSLSILPRVLRTQLSVAYLVARAADTIADTRVVRAERRLELLSGLRGALADGERVIPLVGEVRREIGAAGPGDGASEAEHVLLERLGDCLRALHAFESGDRARTQKVIGQLITGMERDITRFPGPGSLFALESEDELDEHCYYAAGCVGEYWTTMTAAHVASVRRLARPDFVARGVRLGKALQMVNVIRDAPADLRDGRCYVPRRLLAAHGLQPADLLEAAGRRRARSVFDALMASALAHVDAAFPYVLAIPRREVRLRLAALWPLWIGLSTLARLRASPDPLDPIAPIKISRQEVYEIVAESTLVVGSDRLLTARHDRRRRLAGTS
jgi:farnesyl-diphosphate farnesyltransferase